MQRRNRKGRSDAESRRGPLPRVRPGPAVLLRRCAYLLCGDWHLAEDLVQNTLVKMYGAWPRIQHTDRPVSYARRTLTHVKDWFS